MINKDKGFTLIELVVVMALIAVLAALGVGAIIAARNASKETAHKANARTLKTGFEAYFAKNGAYPAAATNATFTATATVLGVALASANECTTQAGGGLSTNTTAGYTITPYDAACTAALTGTNVLTGP